MQQRAVHKPIKINRDKDLKYIGLDEAFYMLNTERNTGGSNQNLGKTIPLNSNKLLCSTDQDSAYPIGSFKSDLTNEVYVFYYNHEGDHFILRVNPDKTCEVVYQGTCLQFSADPKHAIKNWRVTLRYDKFCAHQGGKQLIWTDGLHPIGMIDVEASIATESFSTPFFDRCHDDCAAIQMCVPSICGAPVGEFMPLDPNEVDLQNNLLNRGFQVRYRHVYYDGIRFSEWSDISTLYFQNSKACGDTEEGFPRCISFRIPIGNPLVDRIQFAYRENNVAQWSLVDTIEKYKPYTSENQKWYERELADLDGYSDEDCSFDYKFCNDKQCATIDVNQTNRVFNPFPREAQGFFLIKGALAVYNYIKGTCPLLESETKKMQLSLNCPDDNCTSDLVKVEFYAIVHQIYDQLNQPIFRMGGVMDGDIDDPSDTAYFGFLPSAQIPRPQYDQFFSGKTRNFIAYIEGTNYSVEMEQWAADSGFVNKRKVGVLSGLAPTGLFSPASFAIYNFVNGGGFYFQKGTFMVPKGTKGFIRLVSHKKETGIGNSQNTSTLVDSVIPTLSTYYGTKNINSEINNRTHELYFDTCDGDVTISEALVIHDQGIDNRTGANSSRSYGGYIKDANGAPVEGAEIWVDGELRSIADHNGYYKFFNYGNNGNEDISAEVRVEQSGVGGFTTVKTVTLSNNYNYSETNITITESDAPGFLDDFYENFSVSAIDCVNQPIGGIRIAVSGSKYKITDAITGLATFKLRNYSSRNREVRGVVMDNGGCFSIDCFGNCSQCMPDTNLIGLGTSFEGVNYTVASLNASVNREASSASKYGLKAGGRFGWGAVVEGGCGRVSGVYPITILEGSVPQEDSFMNIPKTQEKNKLSFCDIDYDGSGMVLPEWGECLKIVRTANLYKTPLQWVIDKAEKLSDGKIRLTIQSLNDYNAGYNFKTNTIYQFLPGDRVEFITKSGGVILDSATYGILNYPILSPFTDLIIAGDENPPADFFNQILIQGDAILDDFSLEDFEGAKIELQRPEDCNEEHVPYFEIGVSIPIVEVSGQKVLVEPTGSFRTFDTFLVSRQIGTFGLMQFEHNNPSDFWGNDLTGISDIGKAHFINKYENEKRWGRNISISSVNQIGRFGDLEKTLDCPEHGDLTGIGVYDGKIGVGIGEFDNFLFQISDDLLRVGNDGVVRAAPADALISDTEPKVQGRYGCQYPHIGSIFFGDGWITWADVAKGAYVKHDFSVAKDISENVVSSYFRLKWNEMEYQNSIATSDIDKYRFCTGFNYHTSALQLTMKRLNGDGINNQKDALLAESETLLLEPRTEEALTYASYAPEEYSNITISDGDGCAFLSFFRTGIWIHPVKSTSYNTFFGVECDRVVTVSVNHEPDIIKTFVSMEIQDEKMWFVSKVLLDDPFFESEIPPRRVKRSENKWNAGFLSNKNGRGGLYASDSVGITPRGYYALVTLVRDNTVNLEYGTRDAAKMSAFDRLDMIIFKYFHSAQSGMKENV